MSQGGKDARSKRSWSEGIAELDGMRMACYFSEVTRRLWKGILRRSGIAQPGGLEDYCYDDVGAKK